MPARQCRAATGLSYVLTKGKAPLHAPGLIKDRVSRLQGGGLRFTAKHGDGERIKVQRGVVGVQRSDNIGTCASRNGLLFVYRDPLFVRGRMPPSSHPTVVRVPQGGVKKEEWITPKHVIPTEGRVADLMLK